MPAWLVFVLSGAVVAAAGVRLARDGDRLGEETGLGGMWIGAILVAGATSLPELLTDLNAIRDGNPSLANPTVTASPPKTPAGKSQPQSFQPLNA